jgi:hypothetical protein
MTRAELALRAPELLAALIDEGRAAGVMAERERLKAIDDLNIKGAIDLVYAAKYGDKPTDAAALALAIVKAGQVAGYELLQQRRVESRSLAAVQPTAIDQSQAAEEAAAAKRMAEYANRRGGSR